MTHQNLMQGRSTCTMTHLVKISDRTIVLLYIIEHVGVTPDIVNLGVTPDIVNLYITYIL